MMNLININFRASFIAALVVCMIGTNTHAQTATAQDASSQSLVRLNVLTLDGSKRATSDVGKDEFRVFEDDVEQNISFFSTEALPLSYGLLIDNSGSLRTQLNAVIEAGAAIINGDQKEDEGFVMRFVSRDKIQMLQDFTSNKVALFTALNNLQVEGGQTALIDAVYVAVNHLIERKQSEGNQPRRRALILVTDGEERDSYHKMETLINLLRESDVQIFAIGLTAELDKRLGPFVRESPGNRAVGLLDRLTKESGGRAFYPASREQLQQDAKEIMSELRTQYVIGYTPAPNPKSKPYRKVKINLVRAKEREKRTVIARSGYVAPVRVTAKG